MIKKYENSLTRVFASGKCWFLTLTFNDEVFENVPLLLRPLFVSSFLKDLNAFDYVAFCDWSKKNNREHYHAVVAIDKIDYKKWTYGAIKATKVRCSFEKEIKDYVEKN